MDRFAELKAFCLVVNHGGFSVVARQLGVATSSVTRLVDTLEERIGTPLLNRSTRSVTVTDTGRAYFQQAMQILSALDDADDAASDHGRAPRGLLRVAAPITFSGMYIAPMLPALLQRYPALEIEMRLSDAVANLVDESIDVAIRIGAADQQPNLIARKLAEHPRWICASPSYLKAHGKPMIPADLTRHNCLQFAYSGSQQSWRLQSADGIEEIPIKGSLHANNSEVLRQAVLGGVGLALLPDWLVRKDIEAGNMLTVLTQYHVNPGAMEIGIYAMYASNRRGSTKVKCFVDMLGETLQAEL
ncbi:MAG: DNA-binding transcriptional regulator, LysR family [Herbaspirillum sp.]|jgi:DNA-binding transcriptional LysR family regulator|nr:DNA-binding transcriptional regulator, LysR family [Herbaspirillum sp.]